MNAIIQGAHDVRVAGDDVLIAPMADATVAQARAETLRASGAWLEVVPGLDSLAVRFDLTRTSCAEALATFTAALAAPAEALIGEEAVVTLPVRYGGEAGPDLDAVAAAADLSPEAVVSRHAASPHKVALLGFQPGFAYLSGLDPALDTPRLARPRVRAPAGSVAIAGGHTGVYPFDGPAGWSIIGRTEAMLYDPEREPPFLLRPGVSVRFEAQ